MARSNPTQSRRRDASPAPSGGRPAQEVEVSTHGNARREPRALEADRIRDLVAHLQQVFWLVDLPEGTPAYVSPAFEQVWGLPLSTVYEAPASVLTTVHPEDRDELRALLPRILEEEQATLEFRVFRPDGSERCVLAQGFAIRDESGQAYRVAGTTEDVTERRRAEGERRKLLEVVTHDLRSPLSSILLQADLIRQLAETAAPQTLRHAAGHIVSTVEQMERLISDLLSAAAIEAGGLTLRPVPTSVEGLLHQAVDRLAPLAAARSLRLEVEAEPELRVKVDPDRLIQVLVNLLDNAVRHTPPGGGIEVRSERRGDTAWLLVKDSGPGIPEAELLHVFDRYWQAGRGTTGGAGLGLSIAKGITEAHGGRIWAVSRPGHGSTFIVALPLDPPTSA